MNRSRLVVGIIFLAVAALLAVLTLTLPEGKMVFMLGDTNVPIAPAIILGILGLVLVITAKSSGQGELGTTTRPAQPAGIQDRGKQELNKRLEAIGWGLLLIMLGGFGLVPNDLVSKGVWSIGVGVIMLGLNVARYLFKIKMSGFTTVLGIISLIGGTLQLLGMRTLEGGILLIILGAYLILKPWFDKRQLFGKVEES
jgi:hypothetical protein